MKWITRQRPKIDRIACPWLIRNFIKKEVQFIYLPAAQVVKQAKQVDAIPYNIPCAEYAQYGEECTFDYIIHKHELTDPALSQLPIIIRGADPDCFDFAPPTAGAWTISARVSYSHTDDHQMLAIGMKIYDALYYWANYVQQEKHIWNQQL